MIKRFAAVYNKRCEKAYAGRCLARARNDRRSDFPGFEVGTMKHKLRGRHDNGDTSNWNEPGQAEHLSRWSFRWPFNRSFNSAGA